MLCSFDRIDFFEIKEIDGNHMWIYFHQSTQIFGKRYPPKPYGFDFLRLSQNADICAEGAELIFKMLVAAADGGGVGDLSVALCC